MDPVTLITVFGGVVAILGFLYLLFIGQKSLFEWWRERLETHGVSVIPVTPPEPQVPTIPNNLPPRGEFIGREKEKARVREALASRWPLICIDGIGGIGKTALALEVAGECLRASKGEIPADSIPTFDGFIWTTAKDRELALNDVLDAIARTLDYPGIAQQPLDEKQESVRKLLQTKPYLLIVDNFETITDNAVRDFLLRLPEPSKALITSREQKLRQAWAVSLKGLEQTEALTLIRSEGRRLGLAAVERGEERVLLHLYQATGGAPLAIKWAVGQIKQKGQSLDTVLAALHEARGDIFEQVFARSWSLLTDNARRILIVMPIFAASASRAAIEAASDVHHYALDEALGQLVEMWLVEATDELEADKRRYSIHPLPRAFAGARLGEDKGWEREARRKAAAYFYDFAVKYGGWGKLDTFPRLKEELADQLATVDWYYQNCEWQKVVQLVMEMTHFLGTYGYWTERVVRGRYALEAARRLADKRALAWLNLNTLGWIYLKRGDYEEARSCVEESLLLYEELSDWEGLVHASRYLGIVAIEQDELDTAEEINKKALDIAKSKCTEETVFTFYSNFGDLALHRGNYAEAEHWYEEARKGLEKVGSRSRLSSRLIDLGIAKLNQEKLDEARGLYEKGLVLSQEQRRPDNIVNAKLGLAVVNEKQGNHADALKLAHESLEMAERLGMRRESEQARALVARLEEKLSGDRLSADG